MKKKWTAMMLAAAMLVATLTGVTPVQTKAETTTTTITPDYMKTKDEYNSVATKLWEHKFQLPYKGEEICEIAITIPKDSVVRFDVKSFQQNGTGYASGSFYLYANQIMTEQVCSFEYNAGTEAAPNTDTSYVVLKKGTYYGRITGLSFGIGDNFFFTTQLYVTAIATKDAFSVTAKKATGNSYDLVFNSNLWEDAKVSVYYRKGNWSYTDHKWDLKPTDFNTAYRVNVAGNKKTVKFKIKK